MRCLIEKSLSQNWVWWRQSSKEWIVEAQLQGIQVRPKHIQKAKISCCSCYSLLQLLWLSPWGSPVDQVMRSWYTAVACPVQPVLLLSHSLAAVSVQPNITWHAYDAAWSTQQEGVNRQKLCLCNTALPTTLLPGFFHHVATAAALHLIHWLTVWGFPLLRVLQKWMHYE